MEFEVDGPIQLGLPRNPEAISEVLLPISSPMSHSFSSYQGLGFRASYTHAARY